MLPILTRFFTPEDYGVVAMFTVLLGIVGTFTSLSIHGAIRRKYFEKEDIDFPNYIANCFYIIIFSATAIGILLWLGSGWINKFTQFPTNWLWAVLAASVGQFVSLVALTLWQVQIKPIPYALYQVLLTLTNIGLSLFFVVGMGMNWKGRIQGQVIAYILFIFISFFFSGEVVG